MKLIKVMLVGLFLNLSFQVNAAEFCVTNAVSLKSALTGAESNNQNNTIKIAAGSYLTNGSAFSYEGVNDRDLEISGGWTTFFKNPCGLQLSGDIAATTLNGESASRVMDIDMLGTADLLISNLRIINGMTQISTPGLRIQRSGNLSSGNVTVERSMFINNEANNGPSALFITGTNIANVKNNLFVANTTGGVYTTYIAQHDGYGVYFTNNTVMFNESTSQLFDQRAGAYFFVTGTSNLLIANNILLNNGLLDLLVEDESDGDYYLKMNNIGIADGAIPIESFGNFSLPTRFEPGILNFTPSATSPLVNAGIEPCFVCPIPVPFDDTWSIGSFDLAGNVRVQNSRADVGAFESPHSSDLIFWSTFGQ